MPKYQLPGLNSLRAFEAAARLRSIKKACEEIHVTHAAVSRRIQQLERQLGRSLFLRQNNRVFLTDDGETLLSAVTAGLSHIERAVTQLTGKRGANRLIISVDPDFAGLWLVPRLADFQALVPDILVDIRADKGIPPADEARIDCAIHYAPVDLKPKGAERLFRSRLFPVCSPALARRQPLRSPEDLRRHNLLHDRSFAEWEQFMKSCAATDIDVRSGVVFSETALHLEAAVRGQGVAMGDDFLAQMHLSEGRLIKPFDSSFLSKNAYFFVVPNRRSRHPALGAFRAWLFRSVKGSR